MRRFYISEMDERALSLARTWGTGVETIAFCLPENLESPDAAEAFKAKAKGFDLTLHAPYYEIFPSAIDPMIRKVALKRLMQAANACQRLGTNRMIVHSGYAPQMYYPEWFVPKSIEFWSEFLNLLPKDFELLLENVLDVCPEHILRVCEGTDDKRLKICLDTGHVNAYSDVSLESWIKALEGHIAHVHLHNNYGDADTHNALDHGSINMEKTFALLDEYAPCASICIESLDALSCLQYLSERGKIE